MARTHDSEDIDMDLVDQDNLNENHVDADTSSWDIWRMQWDDSGTCLFYYL